MHSPIPDLQTLCGAYVKNIAKLEQSAEELSQGGSDIGEEIKRMKQDQDREEASRRSSLVASLSLSTSSSLRNNSSSSIAPASASSLRRSRPRSNSSAAAAAAAATRGRNASTSSYANSIVDVNSAARWGGYSPGGFHMTSPSVSRLSSFHRPSAGMMPEPVQEGRPLDSPLASPVSALHLPTRRPSQQSVARTDDIAYEQLDYPEDIREEREDHEDERLEMTTQQHAALQGGELHSEHQTHHDEGQVLHEDHSGYDTLQFEDMSAPLMDRSSTPDTYRQARSLFRDFDGTHFASATENLVDLEADGKEMPRVISLEFEADDKESHRLTSLDMEEQLRRQAIEKAKQAPLLGQRVLPQNRVSRTSAVPRPVSRLHLPPGENMTFYPAPVPRILNLPKRLSQFPPASARVQRPPQTPNPLPAESRQSTLWLPPLDFQNENDGEESRDKPSKPQDDRASHSQQLASPKLRQSMMNPRLSRMSMANMPPQPRASAYFDQSSKVQHDIKVGQSAGATLDSILAASVNAPVNVFTDHPFAGPVDNDAVYGKPKPTNNHRNTLIGHAKSANSTVFDLAADHVSRRRASGASAPLQKRNSVASMLTDFGGAGGHKLKKRNSKMSFATDLGLSRGEDAAYGQVASEQGLAEDRGEMASLQESDQDSEAEEEDYEEELFNEKYPFYAQPTTLLAELQARKAAQKTRNRTAWTNGGNGMHSTLLQMDAVAAIEKAKKQGKRTRLAWEDPMLDEYEQEDDQDEDIPLGVLYPERDGLANRAGSKGVGQSLDWNKPLGLLERRELEDNEPLAQRRNRLRGISPDHHLRLRAQRQTLMRQQREAEVAAATVPLPSDEDEDEPAGESLADRRKRLGRKSALNAALGDLVADDDAKRKSTFADDLLGQFGTAVHSNDRGHESKAADTRPATASAQAVEQIQTHEGETLAQRRARLQRERTTTAPNQRDVSNPDSASPLRPNFHRTSSSLANLLAANPVVAAKAGPPSRLAHAPPPGSLLAASAAVELEARNKLRERNARSLSYNALPANNNRSSVALPVLMNPAVVYQQRMQDMQDQMMRMQLQLQMQLQHSQSNVSLLQQQQQHSQYGGVGQQYPQQQLPAFAQPTAPLPYAGTSLLQQQQQFYGNMGQMHLWNSGYGGTGGRNSQQWGNSSYGGLQQTYAMASGVGGVAHEGAGRGGGPGHGPGGRDLIDRWRLSVAGQ